ncbi:MAG TPA: GNAT family N-acetyltransferase [Myxococcota bacterium]|nr:GNAT family N-acetyltransferase [Myxococcota bacterium]
MVEARPKIEIDELRAPGEPLAAALLARAFESNPLNLAAIQSPDTARRRRCNMEGMRCLLPVARVHGLVLAASLEGQLAGVLIAALPFSYPFPPAPFWARMRAVFIQGLTVARRWRETFESLDARHPTSPHWYLGTLGVEPSLQGRGVGTALAKDWLARVDPDRVAAYLETDRAENLPFYARLGFRPVAAFQVLGVEVTAMERAPRAEVR